MPWSPTPTRLYGNWLRNFSFVVVSVAVILCLQGLFAPNEPSWSKTFRTRLNSQTLQLNCLFRGVAICCEAIEIYNKTSLSVLNKHRGIGRGYREDYIQGDGVKHMQKQMADRKCTINREYISSPYELMHFEMAMKFEKMNRGEHRKHLIDFITSEAEVQRSREWLKRVGERMQFGHLIPTETEPDKELLSKFIVTRLCSQTTSYGSDGNDLIESNTSWIEYIEPLTVHARHPFAYHHMKGIHYQNLTGKDKVHLTSADFVLLQSAVSLYNATVPNFGQREGQITKHFLFDAGTSTFDSSLYWFVCAYSQQLISFDQMYGWELSLLEPQDFWERVPGAWKPYYHFLNAPITGGSFNINSPSYAIKSIATVDDFVAYKLDVDHPSVEIPEFLDILSDEHLAKLIDEFFFEFHFNCVLLFKTWGFHDQSRNYTQNALLLDRLHAMDSFRRLRVSGVRAHFWP